MKKIMLATDGSQHADAAAQFLFRLPHDEAYDLTVLTVLDDAAVTHSYAATISMNELIEHEKATAYQALQRINKIFAGSNVKIHGMTQTGHRGDSIIETAKLREVDLLVVGAKGHSMVTRLILGSTSDYVATHAHCNVLVVRTTGTKQTDRPLRVAVGYEQSGPAQAALDEFAEIPWLPKTEVHFVNIVSYATGLLTEIAPDPEPLCAEARLKVDQVVKQFKPTLPLAMGKVIASEHVGEGLVRYVEDNRCDLIVIGESPQSASTDS